MSLKERISSISSLLFGEKSKDPSLTPNQNLLYRVAISGIEASSLYPEYSINTGIYKVDGDLISYVRTANNPSIQKYGIFSLGYDVLTIGFPWTNEENASRIGFTGMVKPFRFGVVHPRALVNGTDQSFSGMIGISELPFAKIEDYNMYCDFLKHCHTIPSS